MVDSVLGVLLKLRMLEAEEVLAMLHGCATLTLHVEENSALCPPQALDCRQIASVERPRSTQDFLVQRRARDDGMRMYRDVRPQASTLLCGDPLAKRNTSPGGHHLETIRCTMT